MDYINNPANFKTDRVFDLTFRTKDIVPSTAYTLTRTATNGAIKLTPLQSGSNQLTVSALPVAGYKFIGWSGDLSGVNSTATITINRDKAITANFAPK
ncbi:MAG: putative repeat protein (TIGR02543 family) [Bradyrhizobium sp.]